MILIILNISDIKMEKETCVTLITGGIQQYSLWGFAVQMSIERCAADVASKIILLV